jgi:hypothetical protein
VLFVYSRSHRAVRPQLAAFEFLQEQQSLSLVSAADLALYAASEDQPEGGHNPLVEGPAGGGSRSRVAARLARRNNGGEVQLTETQSRRSEGGGVGIGSAGLGGNGVTPAPRNRNGGNPLLFVPCPLAVIVAVCMAALFAAAGKKKKPWLVPARTRIKRRARLTLSFFLPFSLACLLSFNPPYPQASCFP